MKWWVVVLIFTMFLPMASSSIFIEPLNEIYNYGDQLSVETKIVPSVTTSGHYVVDLKCGEIVTLNVFNSFFSLPANIERPVTVTTQILNPLLDNVTVACFLRATYNAESINSNSFVLSRKINIDAELDFDELVPGRYLSISGTAVKESGILVDGFIEVFVKSLNLYKSSTLTQGVFNLSLMLPTDSKSGEHDVILEIHNTDYSSKKINFGNFSEKFTISQVLKEMDIYIDDENVDPDADFVFRIDTFDQAMDPMVRDVSLTINGPKGVPYMNKVIKSGESHTLRFPMNDTPGYWSIEATVDDLSDRKLFYLAEIQKIHTGLINDTLFVTNIGNSPYSGPLEITIGSHVEVKQIRLEVGETQKLTLHAPDGDYSISVSEGGESKVLGSSFLTGNAIKVTDLSEDFLGTITNPLIWWLAVILLILIIILVQVKLRLQRLPHPMATNEMTHKVSAPVMPAKSSFEFTKKVDDKKDESPIDSSVASWFGKTNPKKESTPMPYFMPQQPKVVVSNVFGNSSGIRERAVAIALYVNGSSANFSSTLTSALSIAQESGAKIYVDGDYRIILFSPRLRNTSDNDLVAVNVGRRMQALFLEHSRDYGGGLLFGIGISDGEIISEIENNKFHFTSTGNLISLAKRIAQSSNMRLLISDSVRQKVISTVKTEASSLVGAWEVTRVVDHSSSRDFIKRFSDRNN